jgi:hypothetical protein
MNLLKHSLSFSMLLLFGACNKHSSEDYSSTFASFDFSHPLNLELTLVTKKAIDASNFCKFQISHSSECTVKVYASSDSTQRGEATIKVDARFSREELTNIVASAEKQYQSVGELTFKLSQETTAK